jgi:hypothetical protein
MNFRGVPIVKTMPKAKAFASLPEKLHLKANALPETQAHNVKKSGKYGLHKVKFFHARIS